MNLRRILLLTTAMSSVVIFGSSQALAEDFDWNGFYAGIGVGGGVSSDGGTLSWDDPNGEIPLILPPGTDLPVLNNGTLTNFPGALGSAGFEVDTGYNVEMDHFVLGIEASLLMGPASVQKTYSENGTMSFTTTETTPLFGTNTTFSTFTNTTSTSYNTFSTTENVTFTQGITTTVGSTTLAYTTTDTYTYFTTTESNAGTTSWYPTSTQSTTSYATLTDTTFFSETVTSTYENPTLTGTSTSAFGTTGEWTSTITGRASVDWLASVKGKVGMSADRALFYVTGGLAMGGVTQSTTATLETPDGGTYQWSGSNSETRYGAIVGVGADFAVTDNMILSGEINYFNLGNMSSTYEIQGTGLNSSSTVTGTQSQTIDGTTGSVGIKFKLN